MAAGQHDLTPSGKIRRPSVEVLCSWIVEAWSGISEEVVAKNAKKTSISNALDGTEDDFLCDCEDAPAMTLPVPTMNLAAMTVKIQTRNKVRGPY
ncbi:hypothetical protein HPB49_006154 [Dermacentor silvarum]|uniref:Uncharacterized protein n=1 Tax=Dermacentor silvarum TaxID=543639 RepID=A0ACB8DW08_DERSI|nr:hypothetical protein HPB49_006154 [Dermacentor silvarum]